MTTALHQEVTWTTARPEENREFVAFVDACFGLPEGVSLRDAFPAVLSPANHRHHFEAAIGGRRVSAATAWVRPWITSSGRIVVACVGNFSTAPAHRGQGLSGRLQSFVLDALRDQGVDWAVLWTDRPALYVRRGFQALGHEVHGDLTSVEWPACAPGDTVRAAGPADAPAMLALYEQHPLRAERQVEDFELHLWPSTSKSWVLERDERIVAYAALGKGADFPGYVHEFGGAPNDVHVLWGEAVAHGAHSVLLPRGTDRYCTGAAASMVGTTREAAMIVRLSGGPRPEATDFAVWGFDSA
jgi:GNAT superfamily N-acetyltransferase